MKDFRRYSILGCSVLFSAAVILSGCKGAEELPTEKIRPALRKFGGIELPKKADGLRAIISHRRDPEIFVTFQTDFEGIGHVQSTFSGLGVQIRDLDADDFERMKKDDTRLFSAASYMEDMTGVKIHDQDSMVRGRELVGMVPRSNNVGYQVYFDQEHKTVYVYAYFL